MSANPDREAHPAESEAHPAESEAHPAESEAHPAESEAHPAMSANPDRARRVDLRDACNQNGCRHRDEVFAHDILDPEEHAR
jgi:hypothetical protein